ncbi:hypothetical protein GCM10010442_22650 [Kitasatospora kifunensis]
MDDHVHDQELTADRPDAKADDVPVLPCLRCDELDARRQRAVAAQDESALVDFRVLMREHARLARCPRARDVVAAFAPVHDEHCWV